MHFAELVTTVRSIFSNYIFPENVKVFWAYVRMVFRNRLPLLSKSGERFLSYRLEFPERAHFFSMLSDIFFRCVYKPPVEEVGTIIDAGSNIGLSALYFRWRKPKARIICFEPNPEAFALLKKNLESNGITDVELHQCALGGEEGSVTLYTGDSMKADNSATTFVGKRVHGQSPQSVQVPMKKLSDFIVGPIDFLKLDIEGAEGDVLEDLEHTEKLQYIQRMAIEFHIYESGEGYPMGKFLSILDRNNFRYVCTPSFSSIEHPSKKSMRTYIIQAKRM